MFGLRVPHPDWAAIQTRQAGLEGTGKIRLRELVKQALRMRPSRLVIGEVRAEDCLDLLLALNAGPPGMAKLDRREESSVDLVVTGISPCPLWNCRLNGQSALRSEPGWHTRWVRYVEIGVLLSVESND